MEEAKGKGCEGIGVEWRAQSSSLRAWADPWHGGTGGVSDINGMGAWRWCKAGV